MWDNLDTSKQRGSAIEELIEQFCKRPFLQDFLFLRPKRARDNKELTDLLVILGDRCLCIELKASGTGSSRSGEKLIDWASKRFVEAGKKAAGTTRQLAISNVSTNHLWQGNVIFRAGDLLPICGIAVVEYLGPHFILMSGIKHQTSKGVSIQYFSLNDFLNLVDLLVTLPDTIEYIKQRASISDDTKNVIGKERDLVATYLLDGHLRPGLSCKDIDGRWSYLVNMHGEAFARKREHDKFTLFFNGIIDELHNQDPHRNSYWPKELTASTTPTSDKQAYLKIATQLNKLPYLHRRDLGRRLFQAAKHVKEYGKSRSFYCLDDKQQWVLAFLITSDMNRESRIKNLCWLAAIALTKLERQNGIAIACPSLDSNQGLDCILYEKVTFNSPEIRRLASLEPDAHIVTLKSFPDPADDAFLPTDEDFE